MNEPPIQNITNEIMQPLERRATQIQRMVRSIRQRRQNADRQYQTQISREFDENMTKSRREALQRQQDSIAELEDILRQEATSTRKNAATTIQSAVRNTNALKEAMKRIKKKKKKKIQQQQQYKGQEGTKKEPNKSNR
jgi:hypothetical protein